MSTATPPTQLPQSLTVEKKTEQTREIRVYGHTALFYWWPVWAAGYIMALLTWTSPTRALLVHKDNDIQRIEHVDENTITVELKGKVQQRGSSLERVYENKNAGIVFSIILFIVILITNVPLRGLSSAIVIVLLLFLTVLLAYLDLWDRVFQWLGQLSLHMNMGFFVFFSTLLFLAWAIVVFGYDRLTYWRVTPGLITQEYVFGGGQRSYDTNGMAFEKLRDDLFRHWVLGLGSGDLIMHPLRKVGEGSELEIHNVLFVGSKLLRIQELISVSPEQA